MCWRYVLGTIYTACMGIPNGDDEDGTQIELFTGP